ncbi:coproporphyrinogen III oxidase [Candidatus Aerophobetes bacterium]|uniref:Heme chaperone HemW n=1 Tax=Aerophobetes bacterium TaxID=2030807 RepID=A0A2A4YH92_UNCAE|nr:MAG: coproporphyrinogen III oxidase [Candidatus Aerophobetes bacterium]
MTGNHEKDTFLSLYFHIPFCTKKCPYCHFYVTKHTPDLEKQLVTSFVKELSQNKGKIGDREIPSIYFGGGTPSKLSIPSLKNILDAIYDTCTNVLDDVEITLEANPEDLDLEYLKSLKEIGINRLSVGVQSLDDHSLQTIQRLHTAKETIEGIQNAKHAGITNISIDLMYDLPNQSLESFARTLCEVKKLPITHLSLYNLVIEENSAYFRRKERIEKTMPKDVVSAAMLKMAIDTFEGIGLIRYEISAFAKDGLLSKHNTGYWLGRDFIGIGPSAFSYMNKSRYKNINNLKKYMQLISNDSSAVDFEEKLEEAHHVRELFLVELRMLKGVDINKYKLPESFHNELSKKIDEKLLERVGDRVRLTKSGTLFYDGIASDLI